MLYIRADMNQKIATGHIMRCISIAAAMREICNIETTFVVADNNASRILKYHNFSFICLESQWNYLDNEIETMKKMIEKYEIKVLLIDTYFVTSKYMQILGRYTQIIYLDDLDMFQYPCNILINYANYYKKFNYEKRYPNTKLLLGCSYVPLRKSFKNIKHKKINKQIENVLLMSGGTDPYGILEKIIDNCLTEKIIDLNIYVICGNYYTDYEQLKGKYKNNSNIHLYQSLKNIEEYMQIADIAISAGGTTLYELSACGTPTICYSFADNQLDNVTQFDEDGLMVYAGDIRYDSVIENIIIALKKLDMNFNMRKEMSVRLQKLVDGMGAERIAKVLECELKIK